MFENYDQPYHFRVPSQTNPHVLNITLRMEMNDDVLSTGVKFGCETVCILSFCSWYRRITGPLVDAVAKTEGLGLPVCIESRRAIPEVV